MFKRNALREGLSSKVGTLSSGSSAEMIVLRGGGPQKVEAWEGGLRIRGRHVVLPSPQIRRATSRRVHAYVYVLRNIITKFQTLGWFAAPKNPLFCYSYTYTVSYCPCTATTVTALMLLLHVYCLLLSLHCHHGNRSYYCYTYAVYCCPCISTTVTALITVTRILSLIVPALPPR